ncbi:MAG: DUF3108 domain-containing protein, partial [Betaproteobacteria bacterium]
MKAPPPLPVSGLAEPGVERSVQVRPSGPGGAAGAAATTTAAPGPQAGLRPGRFAVAESARLLYDVLGTARGLSYQARSELLWQQDSQHYEARLELDLFPLGSRIQTSDGRITADGLAPTRFSDKARSEQA